MKTSLLLAVVMAVSAAPSAARPLDPTQNLRYQALQPPVPRLDSPVFHSANQGTVYFGGTFWNADSSRWEALQDSVWTFDSGVGSSFNHDLPGVNPYKDPSLHATMEGWIGFDNSYSEVTYFRRSTECAIGNGYSLHCGVTLEEARDLCWAEGAGYGNSWNVCVGHVFDYTGGPVTLEYDYTNETEETYDFSRVVVDTTGDGDPGHETVATEYTGVLGGHETLSLVPGETLPAGPRNGILVKFCFDSDSAWSDEDGYNSTTCGAFSVDNVALSGGIDYPLQDFESGDGGWVLQPPQPGPGGDWSNIVHLNDLPPYDASFQCGCNLQDSVLVFEDLTAPGHGLYQDNLAASPWIDLRGEGVFEKPGRLIEMKRYINQPFLNYVYDEVQVQWYPARCLVDPDNPRLVTSPWISGDFIWYPSIHSCTTNQGRLRIDFSYRIPPEAERVRIAVGMLSYCRFYANCTGISDSSPWFDDIRFGVYGTTETPIIVTRTLDQPQDSFPTNGTLGIDATGRVDCNNIQGAASPEIGTSLGDTLVVEGAEDSQTGAEVWVQFAIRPGPGVGPGALAALHSRTSYQETRGGLDWYAARMDTAERAGHAYTGSWMTAFHEGDPGFQGTDTDLDPADIDPNGRMTRLKNDIFPDNLLTPGSRLELFYKSRYVGGSAWFTVPDTTGGNYLEMEVLPSSMDTEGHFNCLLYVDHFDGRGARPFIEQGLQAVLPGGSANAENAAWDRYDVRAPSSQQASFGRPSNTEYGATLVQALGYKTILWNSGNLDAFNLTKEDADVLVPWFTLEEFGGRNLYLSGDGLAKSMVNEAASEPSAAHLLTDVLGVTFTCSTMRNEDCPPGSPLDQTACVLLDPVAGAQVSTRPLGGTQLGEGNGCPEMRSFDVIQPSTGITLGVPQEEESYVGSKTADYASVSSVLYDRRGGFRVISRAVVDGLSLHVRRDPAACTAAPGSPPQAVQERLEEVLGWFGTGDTDTCMDVAGAVGVPGDGPVLPVYRTGLAGASPNPLRGGAGARIRFTLAQDGPIVLAVYDLRGARVRTLLDGPGTMGEHQVLWDGTDASGRRVARGVYFYRLTTGDGNFTKKLVVLGGTN